MSLEDLKQNDVFHNDLHRYELNLAHRETDLATASTLELPIHDVTQRISLLTEDDLEVWGVAYYIEPQHEAKVREYLDVREQDGYSTHKVVFHVHSIDEQSDHSNTAKAVLNECLSDGNLTIESMIYIGTIDNESFVGPEKIGDTASIIRNSVGPSGPNIEYLEKLTLAVRNLDPQSRSRDYYLEDLTTLAKSGTA